MLLRDADMRRCPRSWRRRISWIRAGRIATLEGVAPNRIAAHVHAARTHVHVGRRRPCSAAWRESTAPRSWTSSGRILAIGAILLHGEACSAALDVRGRRSAHDRSDGGRAPRPGAQGQRGRRGHLLRSEQEDTTRCSRTSRDQRTPNPSINEGCKILAMRVFLTGATGYIGSGGSRRTHSESSSGRRSRPDDAQAARGPAGAGRAVRSVETCSSRRRGRRPRRKPTASSTPRRNRGRASATRPRRGRRRCVGLPGGQSGSHLHVRRVGPGEHRGPADERAR